MPKRAGFDFFCDGSDGRCAAALEADVDALRGLHALGDFERLLGLGDVDPNGFFAVDMFACGDRGFQMLHVEERRGRDLDEVDRLGCDELLKGVRAVEEQLVVDGLAAEAGVELVEMIVAEGKLVGKDIGQRDHLRGGVVGERCGDGGAAIAAPEQAKTDGGVGLVAEGGAGLEQQQAAGGSGLDKFAAIHAVTSRITRSR